MIGLEKPFDAIADLIDQIQNIDQVNVVDRAEFGGAGLVVTSSSKRVEHLSKNHPNDIVVLTPHSKELSWLIDQLKVGFESKLNFVNKHVFYPDLGKAAIAYQKKMHPEDSENVKDLLVAVLLKAYQLLDV